MLCSRAVCLHACKLHTYVWESQPLAMICLAAPATLALEHASFAPLGAGCAAPLEGEWRHHHQHEFHDESNQ